jgi:WD40 repeat protein
LKLSCVSVDSTMHTWDIRTAMSLQESNFYKGWIECAQFDKDIIIAGSYDRLIKVFSRTSQKITNIMEGHSGTIFSLAFDKTCGKGTNLLATGGGDKKIKLWDLDNHYKCVNTLNGFDNSVQCLQFNNSKLVAGSLDSHIMLYDFDPYSTL